MKAFVSKYPMGLRLIVMALVFLVMSCEEDGGDGGCLGGTDGLIVGCSDGCGTGLTPIGDGCIGSCIFGGDGDGCGSCAGEGCDMGCGDCGACGDCGDPDHYEYDGDVVEGAVQVHATNSLFAFVETQLLDIVKVAAEGILDHDSYCERCTSGAEDWDCGECDKWAGYCLEPISEGVAFFTAEICNRNRNCTTEAGGQGCWVHVKLGTPELDTVQVSNDHARADVYVPIDDLNGPLPSSVLGNCDIHLGKHGGRELSVKIGAELIRNPNDGNTEVYVGGDQIRLERAGLMIDTNCFVLNVGQAFGLINTVIDGLVDGVGAVTCRGCDSIEDCGGGATECRNGTCRDSSGRMCQGLQLGADVKVDAGGLLQAIDPGAEGVLGARAYLGGFVESANDGLQLAARLGAKADPSNLCVPVRPAPVKPGVESCRDGATCPSLDALNTTNQVYNPTTDAMEEFHLGIGVGMGGLNQVLWSAYSSGLLCLSISGEADGLEMLGTDLVSVFLGTLSTLTYGKDQPLMIQLRPQQAPIVDFKPDEGQGAELDVKIPELNLDFYTIVDQRYMRVFTLQADVELPLGLHVSNNTLEIAIGDLANVIDPDSVSVSNIEMVSASEVRSLVNNLPAIIGGLTGVLGDELIPPIDIPDFQGIELQMVGPGITTIEENGDPSALGIFARLGFSAEDLPVGGLRAQLEPAIQHTVVDIQDPNALRAMLARKRNADESFSYHDLMPHVEAHMAVTGTDVAPENIEYAYRINGGPWSFWTRGPVLAIDNPMIAGQDRFVVEITARHAGHGSTGSSANASFEFVNDYTAPRVQLTPSNGTVRVDVTDNVFSTDELTMQVRLNGGAWSERAPIAPIDIQQLVREDAVAVDVMVEDPRGNARSVRRTFGQKAAAPAASLAAETPDSASALGCMSSEQRGGWLAALVLLLLVVARRKPRSQAVAASPMHVAIAILGFLLISLGATGCVDNSVGLRGEVCDPPCGSNEQCVGGICEPLTCETDEECPGAGKCVDGACVGPTECSYNDDCEYGHICKDGYCAPSECSTSDECSHLSCPEGELPFCDYDDYPTVEAGECICSDGVPMRDYGSWLNMMQLEDESVVALAYHNHYTDLILGELQEDDVFEWTFVDGVPDGPIEMPPTGRREGIRAKGDDAGKYVAATHEHVNGQDILHAAYQHETLEEGVTKLRYARAVREADAWNWTFVDIVDEHITGLFPSIVLVPGDTPEAEGGVAIVYMTGDIAMDPGDGSPMDYFTELSVAWSATRSPEAETDFVLTQGIDQVANPQPCGGLCASDTLCIDAQNVCVATSSSCGACDADAGEQCVVYNDTPQCMVASAGAGTPFSTIPDGIGLFSDAVVQENGHIQVAYYDEVHGNLKLLELFVDGTNVVPVNAALIVDGEAAGESTGDVGRWAQIHAADTGELIIFYEDTGRAELRAAVVSGANVDITVLDDGRSQNDDDTLVASNRVGTSIDALAREDGGFDVYYQDATDLVVRHAIWDDMSAVPSNRPYAVFGSEDGLARDLMDYDAAVNRPDLAVATEGGAYGLYTQVLRLEENTLFASKRIGATTRVAMDVQAARLSDEEVDDGSGPGGEEPGGGLLECSSPGSSATSNGTKNPCRQCEAQTDGSYWTEKPAESDFYRCVAHHNASAYNTSCDVWAFFSDSSCGSSGSAEFRLNNYGTNRLCARSSWEDSEGTRDEGNATYWEKVSNPESLVTPQWPADFAEMVPKNNNPNTYTNTFETRVWLFERAFRYLGQMNGEPGPGDADGRDYFLGMDAASVNLAPGETEWFSFYYNDRRGWQDRVGVLLQFDDEHMEVEAELSFVCAGDGGGGRPRLDGIRYCSAEGHGNKGDQRAALGARCGDAGDLSLTQRQNAGGELRTRYSSCVADTALAYDDLPWAPVAQSPGDNSLTPSNWGQERGGVYVEGHLDCGAFPSDNSGGRSGWAFVRVTRKATDERTDVCTPIYVRPTWFHHGTTQPYDACW